VSGSAITIETIEAAEKLAGVAYTAAGRQLMLDNLEGQRQSARARRALSLANGVPMASRSDRRLPGSAAPPPRLCNLGMALEAGLAVAERRPTFATQGFRP
jgi:hypothetical protein